MNVGFTIDAAGLILHSRHNKNDLERVAREAIEKMPAPKYKIDAFDGLFFAGMRFSVLRDNEKNVMQIMTIDEAHMLDEYAAKMELRS